MAQHLSSHALCFRSSRKANPNPRWRNKPSTFGGRSHGGVCGHLWLLVWGEVVRDDPADAGEVVRPFTVPEDSLCLVRMPFSKPYGAGCGAVTLDTKSYVWTGLAARWDLHLQNNSSSNPSPREAVILSLYTWRIPQRAG